MLSGEDSVEEEQHLHGVGARQGHLQADQLRPVPHSAAPRNPRPEQRLQRNNHRQESRAFYASLTKSEQNF